VRFLVELSFVIDMCDDDTSDMVKVVQHSCFIQHEEASYISLLFQRFSN